MATEPDNTDSPLPATPPDQPAEEMQSESRSKTAVTGNVPPAGSSRIPSTRAGTVWVALCATALMFVALIVFLLQNTRSTRVSFLWMEGSAPLAVTLLIAAVGSAVITGVLGTVRIAQLRRLTRRRSTTQRN